MTRLAGVVGLLAVLAGADCAPETPCGLRTCDIRDADCQRMAATAAACLRDVPGESTPVVIVPRDQFVADAMSTTVTPEEAEAFRRWNAGFAALGLAPTDNTPGADNAASAAQIGGFYDPDARQITIIDDGRPLDSMFWVGVLVHENVHAIQDARLHLDEQFSTHATDLDRALAFGAVVEGDATYVEDLARAGFFGLGKDDVDWPAVIGHWQDWARSQAQHSPLPVTLAWAHFRYPFGTGYVKGAFDYLGWSRVDTLYGRPPGSTREVMATFGETEPAGGAWDEALGADASPILDEGRYELVGTERMGAWLLEAFINRAPQRVYGVEDLPRMLRGDVLSIFHDLATGGAVAFWRLRFAPGAGAYFLGQRTAMLPVSRLETAGTDSVIVAASDAATLAGIPPSPAYQPSPTQPSAAPFAAARHGVRCVRRAFGEDAP